MQRDDAGIPMLPPMMKRDAVLMFVSTNRNKKGGNVPISHHTGAQFVMLSFHTTELIKKMRHPRPVQTMYMHTPVFHAVDRGRVLEQMNTQDSHLHCRCQGKDMDIRTTPINDNTEKAVLEAENPIFFRWSKEMNTPNGTYTSWRALVE